MTARIFAVGALAALVGCGGGGGGSAVPSAPNPTPTNGSNARSQTVSISLLVPNNGSGSSRRRPAYISASALGAGIVVTQGATTTSTTIDLSSGSSACSGSGSSRTCTGQISVPVGSDTFTVTIYASAPAGGVIPANAPILGVGQTVVNVVAGQTSAVSVIVGGEVAGYGATVPSGSLPANGTAQTAAIVIAPTDFGDNPITSGQNDPYANPITVAVTEPAGGGHAWLTVNGGASTLSTVVTNSSQSVTLHYDGGGSPGYSFIISLSATGVATQSATIAPLIASIGGSAVTKIPLSGSVASVTLGFSEAGATRTYAAPALPAGCSGVATIGAITGSGSSGTIPVHGGTTPSASGCSVTINDGADTSLTLPVTNTPIGATVTVNGTQITPYGGYTNPYGITKGPDGNLWFADQGTATVYAINPSTGSLVTQASIGGGDLFDIATGSDGALWVTDQAIGGVDRVTTTGVTTQYPYTITPDGIASNPADGTMLIADETSGGLYQLTIGGGFSALTTSQSGTPTQVAYASNGGGEAWFAEGAYIGECTIANCTATLTEDPIPGGNTAQYVAVGADGNIWFTASGGATPFIGMINPSTPGTINQYSTGLAGGATPLGIAAGIDNAMWFVDPGTETVGQIGLTSHTITTYAMTGASSPQEIVRGPDGSLWATDRGAGSIWHIVP